MTEPITDLLAGVRLTRPWVLWVPVGATVLLLLLRVARWLIASRLPLGGRFGSPGVLGETTAVRKVSRYLGEMTLVLGIACVSVAAAGPTWGIDEETTTAVGRDLIVVLDLSRSMLAEDMAEASGPERSFSRFAAARAGLLQLADAAERRGGHRLALIVFAARPMVVCPLTGDYEHFRTKLRELDARYPPPEVSPSTVRATSGTRIGASLQRAVELLDPEFLGHQDILLVSDGDDPVPDAEYRLGINAARQAEVPIHVVGLGNPDEGSMIPLPDRSDVLRASGEVVRTRLHESPLESIASETRGIYLSTRTTVPDLGPFFHERIEPRPSRQLPDEALPRPRDRSNLFLVPALVLLLIGWWLVDRRPRLVPDREEFR